MKYHSFPSLPIFSAQETNASKNTSNTLQTPHPARANRTTSGCYFASGGGPRSSPIEYDLFVKQAAVSPAEARAKVAPICVVHHYAQHIARWAVEKALPKAYDVRMGQLRQQRRFLAGLSSFVCCGWGYVDRLELQATILTKEQKCI